MYSSVNIGKGNIEGDVTEMKELTKGKVTRGCWNTVASPCLVAIKFKGRPHGPPGIKQNQPHSPRLRDIYFNKSRIRGVQGVRGGALLPAHLFRNGHVV